MRRRDALAALGFAAYVLIVCTLTGLLGVFVHTEAGAIRQRDAEAMAILQKAYPDRKVIPVYAMSLNLSGGGIHCLTKNVPQY